MILRISLHRGDPCQQALQREAARLQQLLGLDRRSHFEVNLILEEMCTNIFNHNAVQDDLCLEIVITCVDEKLRMLFIDNGSPFDPVRTSPPDISLPPEKRQPGGLGLLLVKKLSCSISYERRKGQNRTCVEKRFSSSTA